MFRASQVRSIPLRRFKVKSKRGIVFFLTTVFVGTMFGVAAAQQGGAAPANAPAGPPPAVRTAVVDMFVLMRAHPKLNHDLKEFRDQQQLTVSQLMTAEKALQDEAKVMMGTVKPGTDGFNQANEILDKKAANHAAEKNKAQRELGLRNMKIQYEAFKSVREEIQNFSIPKGIAVVVDVRGTDPDADEMTNAEMEVGQTVVWNSPSVNLTPYIVQILNQKFNQYPAAANIVNGKVVFVNTNQNDGPGVPQLPAPGAARQQQPVAQPQPSNNTVR